MSKQFYFLSPVEVMKVTKDNLEEVAAWCGGVVQETESTRRPGKMDKYVWVPTPKDTKISWAFPGQYVTKRVVVTEAGSLKESWAVFRKDYFEKNYFETPNAAIDATWAKKNPTIEKPAHQHPALVGEKQAPVAPITVVVNNAEKMLEEGVDMQKIMNARIPRDAAL